MLGWEILVLRKADTAPKDLVAHWETGMGGVRWLDQLAKDGHASDLGGNGYPCKYTVTAGVLLPILTRGLPTNSSPLVIGDDYVLPKNWSEEITWIREVALACEPSELLTIEAWDQS